MRYNLRYDMIWDAIVEVEEGSEQIMKDMLLFWINGQDRIDMEDGDITKAFLKMLGEHLLPMSMDWDNHGIIEEFKTTEGWAPMDGSMGLKIIRVDNWLFDSDDFYIAEVK